MDGVTPRLRMFAGPNGSGKSTLKSYLPPNLLGVYLNPDEIEQEICNQSVLNFTNYGVSVSAEELRAFFADSTFLKEVGFINDVAKLKFTDSLVEFGDVRLILILPR